MKRDVWTAAAWASMSSLVVLSSVLPLPGPVAVAVCALALAVAVLTWSELCAAWGERPYRLGWTALVPSLSAPFAVSEPALVKFLIDLAGRDRTVLDGAAAHIDELRWSPVTARALGRVHAARRIVTLVPAARPRPAVAPARRTS